MTYNETMNFLAHHVIGLRWAVSGAPPEFFAGNVLPDLLSMSGDGRLRGLSPALPPDGPLEAGIRLHLTADHAFHAGPAFKEVTSGASELLRSGDWEAPPRRVFFLAHVFVELALDAHLLRAQPGLADDLYDRLRAADPGAVHAGMSRLLTPAGGSPPALPRLASTVASFTEAGYLNDYRSPRGLAVALARVSRRGGVGNFETEADRQRLAAAFEAFAPRVAEVAETLLTVTPAPAGPWYNEAEITPARNDR
jgi:hypothetical protein